MCNADPRANRRAFGDAADDVLDLVLLQPLVQRRSGRFSAELLPAPACPPTRDQNQSAPVAEEEEAGRAGERGGGRDEDRERGVHDEAAARRHPHAHPRVRLRPRRLALPPPRRAPPRPAAPRRAALHSGRTPVASLARAPGGPWGAPGPQPGVLSRGSGPENSPPAPPPPTAPPCPGSWNPPPTTLGKVVDLERGGVSRSARGPASGLVRALRLRRPGLEPPPTPFPTAPDRPRPAAGGSCRSSSSWTDLARDRSPRRAPRGAARAPVRREDALTAPAAGAAAATR